MTDIVERLRQGVNGQLESYALRVQAADEIEALRQRFDEAVANAAKWEQLLTRKELDNAMQHAFGLLSLRVAQEPSDAGCGAAVITPWAVDVAQQPIDLTLSDLIAAKMRQPAMANWKTEYNEVGLLPIIKVGPQGVSDWRVVLMSGREIGLRNEEWKSAAARARTEHPMIDHERMRR